MNRYQAEIEEFRIELINILDYWRNNTIDLQYEGFYGKIDHFNTVVAEAPKGAVLNARILWTFSAAYNYFKDTRYLTIASRAFKYLRDNFVDAQHRGLLWEVDFLGNPLNSRKQIYAQGFGIYGLSEYYKASENQESLDLAIDLFDVIEEYSFDAEFGGYIEALNKDWSTLEDMRLSDRDLNYPKSMNTHLHILEPYTNLYKVWKDNTLQSKIELLVQTFIDRIINKITHHFELFFTRDWNVKSQIVSYGHDIEGSWLLYEAVKMIENKALIQEVGEIALKMVDVTIEEGMDSDGALFYEYDKSTEHLDGDKHWWPQAEAIVGLLNAYQISKDEKYLNKAFKVWSFIKEKLVDDGQGEWFWKVAHNGVPYENEDKAGFWKCPYHNSRACLEAIQRLGNVD